MWWWWRAEEVVQNTTRALYLVVVLLLLTFIVVVAIGLALLWAKWETLPPQSKLLVIIAIIILGLMVALITGTILESQVISIWETSVARATHSWRLFDGWTRANQWVGALLLALLPVLFWTCGQEE